MFVSLIAKVEDAHTDKASGKVQSDGYVTMCILFLCMGLAGTLFCVLLGCVDNGGVLCAGLTSPRLAHALCSGVLPLPMISLLTSLVAGIEDLATRG